MSQTRVLPHDPIAKSHQQFVDAILKGDIATLATLFTKNAVLMPPNDTTLFGRAELEEWYQEYFEAFRVTALEIVERELTEFTDCVIERWTYLVAIEPVDGGERIRDDGRSLNIWSREDGEWRMSQSMFNSIRPIGSGTIRFLARLKKKPDRPLLPGK